MASDSNTSVNEWTDPPVVRREGTLAIVLGASEWPSYPDFHSSPSFRRSALEFAEYLRAHNGLNLSSRNVRVLIDPFDDAPEILRQLRAFIRERRADLSKSSFPATDLLLYYVGHGGFGDNDAFFLSIRSTDESDPLATSITAESLGRLIRDDAAGLRNYLLLDCCFAASATKVFMTGGPLGVAAAQLRDILPPQGDVTALQVGRLPKYGTALLCASGPREPAKAPTDLPYTMFTGGLLEVLRNGDPSSPDWLSLDDVQRQVRARLEAHFGDKAVLPQVHVPQQRMGRLDLVPLFRNPAYSLSDPVSTLAPLRRTSHVEQERKSLEEQRAFEAARGEDRSEDPRGPGTNDLHSRRGGEQIGQPTRRVIMVRRGLLRAAALGILRVFIRPSGDSPDTPARAPVPSQASAPDRIQAVGDRKRYTFAAVVASVIATIVAVIATVASVAFAITSHHVG